MRKYTVNNANTRRNSVYPSERRDPRLVRDKEYQFNCLEKLKSFLTNRRYDGNLKNLNPPSVRDFQNIFKEVVSILLPDYEYVRFEEDVLSILKMLRYPYVNEINRSQLITITPHVWPVVLSMLIWLIELGERIDESEIHAESFDYIFFEYLCNAYNQFMRGEQEEETLESRASAFFDKEESRRRELNSQLEGLNCRLDELKSIKLVDECKKYEDMEKDQKSLLAAETDLDRSIEKIDNELTKFQNELSECEEKNADLRKQKDELLHKIEEQPIHPNEVKAMNSEKVELLREIEILKPKKEEKIQQCKNQEIEYDNVRQRVEELKYELNNIYVIDDEYQNKPVDYLEEILVTKRIDLNKLMDYKAEMVDKKSRLSDLQKDMEIRLKDLQEKLFRTGKLYIEKKELAEVERRKCKKEMENLETELSKLSLESENALLISEQSLQKARINLDRLKNKHEVEKEKINAAVYRFYMNSMGLIDKIEDLYEEMNQIVKEYGTK